MRFNSAKQAWHDAYSITDWSGDIDVKVQFGMRDNDWRIANGVEAGKVQSVVSKLKPLLKSWGMYAYTPRYSDKDVNRVRNYLWCEYARRFGLERHADRRQSMVRLLTLQEIVIDEKLHNERNGGTLYNKAELSILLAIQPQHFDRDWGDTYKRCRGIIDKLPPKALGPVAELVSEMIDIRMKELDLERA